MQSLEIEQYLAELGAALQSQGIKKPIRMLLIGGAYMMLLANAPRTTDDIEQYMVALKILAGRDKDIADCRILLPQTHIRTRKQAQRVLDRYILPDAQQEEAETIEYSLNVLFGSESEGEP